MKKKIKIISLKIIKNYKGKVIKVLNKDDSFFSGFGEFYVTTIFKNCFKSWRMHKTNTCNLLLIHGKIKLVIISKDNKFIKSSVVNSKQRKLIVIPPNYWFAFKNLGYSESIIVNLMNKKHNNNEVLTKPRTFFKNITWN